ncbi:transposase [Streptomyces hainanensis]|uniref:transposase n=1 Tax=Streptomyces hainanensis TaxID=402648 RepID=UPI0014052DAE
MVVDHFHVVQLANKMLNTVRRRTTATLRGRRLPQPRQPRPTHTLRHHTPSPRTSPHCSTLKTRHGAGTTGLRDRARRDGHLAGADAPSKRQPNPNHGRPARSQRWLSQAVVVTRNVARLC